MMTGNSEQLCAIKGLDSNAFENLAAVMAGEGIPAVRVCLALTYLDRRINAAAAGDAAIEADLRTLISPVVDVAQLRAMEPVRRFVAIVEAFQRVDYVTGAWRPSGERIRLSSSLFDTEFTWVLTTCRADLRKRVYPGDDNGA